MCRERLAVLPERNYTGHISRDQGKRIGGGQQVMGWECHIIALLCYVIVVLLCSKCETFLEKEVCYMLQLEKFNVNPKCGLNRTKII